MSGKPPRSDTTEEQIRDLIARTLSIDPTEINIDARMYSTRNWDSLGQLEIVMELEAVLDRRIPDDAIESLTSYTGIVRYSASPKGQH